MTRKAVLELLALVLGAGVVWLVFTLFPIFPDRSTVEFPIDHEEKLGDLLMKNITGTHRQIRSEALDSALKQIYTRLSDAMGPTDFDYKIVVVSSPTINAFALPGGHIVIYSGLVEFAESPEELAGVIAHEMGHIENRDVVTRLLKDLGLTVLLSGLGGNDAVLIGEITKTAVSTSFDRKQEERADRRSMELLEKSGISPRVVASLFRRLDDRAPVNKQLEIIMTHPHNNSRIKASLEYPLSDGFVARPFDIEWERVRSSLQSAVSSAQN